MLDPPYGTEQVPTPTDGGASRWNLEERKASLTCALLPAAFSTLAGLRVRLMSKHLCPRSRWKLWGTEHPTLPKKEEPEFPSLDNEELTESDSEEGL